MLLSKTKNYPLFFLINFTLLMHILLLFIFVPFILLFKMRGKQKYVFIFSFIVSIHYKNQYYIIS